MYGPVNFLNHGGGTLTVREFYPNGDRSFWSTFDGSEGGRLALPGDQAQTGVSDGVLVSSPTGPSELAFARSKDGALIELVSSSLQSWTTARTGLLSGPSMVVDGEDVWSSAMLYTRYLSFANKIELFIAAPMPGTTPTPGQEIWERSLKYPGAGVSF